MRLSTLIKPAVLGFTALASSITLPNVQAAPITWNGWTFDYEVGVNSEGLALKNVNYQTHTLLKKVSLPVIKGEYFDESGALGTITCPFQDKIDGELSPMPWANNATLSQREFTKNGRQWYEIGIYKKINSKEFFQAYYLSADGLFDAHLYVRGKECAGYIHQYPYWRIDTDIDGAANDAMEIYERGGKARAYQPVLTESASAQLFNIYRERDLTTNAYVQAFNSTYNFNHPDGTSTIDWSTYGTLRSHQVLYKASEDKGWPFDVATTVHSPYVNNENINGKDIVAWYTGDVYSAEESAVSPDTWRAIGVALVPSWVKSALPDVVVGFSSYGDGSFYATITNYGVNRTPPDKAVGVGYTVDGIFRTWTTVLSGSLAPGETVLTTTDRRQRFLVPNGNHTFTAWVDDINRFPESNENNNKFTDTISITGPDSSGPYVKFTAPVQLGAVSGTAVTLSAMAYDNVAMKGVQFQRFNSTTRRYENIGVLDTAPPYITSWDSTTVASGLQTLKVSAYDAAGFEDWELLTVNVTASASQRPDIVVTAFGYADGKFFCTIKNQGGETIPSDAWIGIGYFVDGKEKTWTYTYGSLAPGESKTLGIIGGAAYTIPSGTHTIKVIADDQSNIMEANETNNTLSQTITVP